MTRVCIVSASWQNVFFSELLEVFAAGLRDRGFAVEHAVDHFPTAADDLVYLVVPHEYQPLVRTDSRPNYRQLGRTVAVCTEQPGTTWFDTAAEVAATCAATVDINALGVAALRERGVDAVHVPLGYVPQWDTWGGVDDGERSIDVAFLGSHTDRRAWVLARCGAILQRRRAALHVVETMIPHRAEDPHFLWGERRDALLRDSKTLLNVHRSELGYMEWLRVVQAALSGAVLVTEHALGHEPFVPGLHFISSRFEDLHVALGALLDDPGRIAAMRDNAYRLLRDEMPMDRALDDLAETVARVAARALPAPDPGEAAPVGRPLPPTVPPPVFERPSRGDAAVMRMALKHLTMEVRGLKAQLHALEHGDDEAPPDALERNAAYEALRAPRVTVVVTVYNYADHVAEALGSLAGVDHDAFEVVVVEDRSTDDSLQIIRETVRRHPWVPTLVVARGANGGLAAGRNLGFELARAPYVFVLDADNGVYPQALTRLEAALDAEPEAAFAYGLIEAFDEQGPGGVMSWPEWDPRRLRYGNFIDAMAMLRRDHVLEVGGYVRDSALYGWEDFAMWCALASRGHGGVRVPEIVARYRVAAHSMVSVTNIDDTSAWATLLRRYPVLTDPALNGAAGAASAPAAVR
jgi:hypothetical protein